MTLEDPCLTELIREFYGESNQVVKDYVSGSMFTASRYTKSVQDYNSRLSYFHTATDCSKRPPSDASEPTGYFQHISASETSHGCQNCGHFHPVNNLTFAESSKQIQKKAPQGESTSRT